MPLNQQPKLQWSVRFPHGPVTISVTMKTTTPNVDLMEAIVVITPARVGITTAVFVSALKCQKPLNHPWKLLKNPGIPPKNQWRATPPTVMLANAWSIQRRLKPLEQTVLPHNGLEMTFVMTKTTQLTVDLMVEIVVTMKVKDGTTTVLIVNVLHNFYVKNVFIHYLIYRNKSC